MELEKTVALKPVRHAFQWHITHRCNLRCAHCYQNDYAEETDGRELTEILDKYQRFLENTGHYGQIYLTGGEPLCHESFFPLIEEISRRGILFSVLTNGTLIGRREANRIAMAVPDYVQVSIDGTPEIHDAVRGKGSFDAAMAGIDRLKEQGVHVLVSFTAQKSNYKCLPELARICRVHGVDKLWWDRVVTQTPNDTERLALSTGEFRSIVRTSGRLNAKYAQKNGRSSVACDRSLQFLSLKDPCRVYKCKAGGDLIVVLADGSVMPCRRLPFVIGNIRRGEFEDIIASSEVMKELRESPLPDGCRGCRYAEKCGGGAKCVTCGQTGRYDLRDINCFHKIKRKGEKQ